MDYSNTKKIIIKPECAWSIHPDIEVVLSKKHNNLNNIIEVGTLINVKGYLLFNSKDGLPVIKNAVINSQR